MTKSNTETKNVLTQTEVESIVTKTFNYQELLTNLKSKSGVIRYLNSEGMDTKTIHKFLTENKVMNNDNSHPIRYQHVRNVLTTIVKKK